jgi:hypothetical protein
VDAWSRRRRTSNIRQLLELPEAGKNLNTSALRQRILKGWDLELAVTTPMGADRGTGQGSATQKSPVQKSTPQKSAPVSKRCNGTKHSNGKAKRAGTPATPAPTAATLRVVLLVGETEIARGTIAPGLWAQLAEDLIRSARGGA